MKSIYEIAKENNISPVTLYKRLEVRDIKPHIVKGVIMLDEDQEKAILVYAKRGRKNVKEKASEQKSVR